MAAAEGTDSRYWQCTDPATASSTEPWKDYPRIHWFPFDHLRLAAHADDLTHGFIGGNGIDHVIDLVVRGSEFVAMKYPAFPISPLPR